MKEKFEKAKTFVKEHKNEILIGTGRKKVEQCIDLNYTNYLNEVISELEKQRDNLTMMIEVLKSQSNEEKVS